MTLPDPGRRQCPCCCLCPFHHGVVLSTRLLSLQWEKITNGGPYKYGRPNLMYQLEKRKKERKEKKRKKERKKVMYYFSK
ncbi:hypothetical protein E1A91_D05G153900v1 [Gossypium mustelinum]|uniref:Uncharacterized protein n=1 Tax=Gossypium mustelinum TaxID=34275 RepID=A0A5D2UY03_GOSMU|nr:hypothetical protein E1A91_D05G153900v1 [Gossypium mustelinum]